MTNSKSKRPPTDIGESQYPLLATKLYVPQPRPNLVPRLRLVEKLNKGMDHKLTLISAPAGFGKTTLLSEWINQSEMPVAWISLDEGDSDPVHFLNYLIAALQTIDAGFGKTAQMVLQSPQPPPVESVLTNLINEITTIPKKFVLVLDDYHLIDAKQIHNIIEFLLDHLPQQMHLVIATRADPPLPLARLRGRNQLTEFRASDLRFTSDETFEFLNKVMKLGLSSTDITRLESRTEGWIAGLQLAALSMQGRKDIPAFIKAFSGDDRHIVDYLVEEVLNRQPEHIRNFLLQTSILDRLSGPLCDTVTGQNGSQQMLNEMEKANLFIVPLDNKRSWYRYHHLFADLLQQRLRQTQSVFLCELHRRASEWYEDRGLRADAVRHALAAEDFERAAGLIELAWRAMLRINQETTWYGWVKALPDELVRARPVLSVAYAFALLSGEMEAAEARLRDAEQWLDATTDMSERAGSPSVEMIVEDEEAFRSLPGTISVARAYHTGALGDVPGTIKYARRALDILPEGDFLWSGAATALLGLAYWTTGDLESAHRFIAEGVDSLRMFGDINSVMSVTYLLADIRMAQGRLREATRTSQQALQLAVEHDESVVQGTPDLYVELSKLKYEQGDLEAATQHLLRSKDLGELAAIPEMRHRWYIAMARIKQAQGDLDGALDLLDEANRVYIGGPTPDVRPLAALKTRVWIAQGRLSEALAWVRERDLSVDDELSYMREFEHITLARVLITQYRNDQVNSYIHKAAGLLKRLLKAAEEGGRTGSVIEILVLQALAHEAQSDIHPALVPLEHALMLAEPEGYVRIFVNEGPPVAELLEKVLNAKVDIPRLYVKKLLTAFTVSSVSKSKGGLVEPLSERELEVLQLIEAGLSNKEITQQLFISLNTVKTHVRNTIGKLGVDSRTKAVAKAKKLGLL